MADLTAHSPIEDIRSNYLEMTRRKRVYSAVMLAVFVALMVAGFKTADDRNAGSFLTGCIACLISPPRFWAKPARNWPRCRPIS